MADRSIAAGDTLNKFRFEFNGSAEDIGDIATLTGTSGIVASATDVIEGITLLNTDLTTISTDNHIFSGGSIIFEGATDDSFETTLAVTDPTADRTLTLPNATGTVSLIDATETLTNKTLTTPTLTSPVFNTAVSGSAVLDEDDMSSDSATKVATQQSIKAYVDNSIDTEMDVVFAADSSSGQITLDSETMTIAGGTTNMGSSGTTTIKSSFLVLNPGGTMSPGGALSPDPAPEAPEAPDVPLVLAPTSPNALPNVGFDSLESAPFEVQIDEADTDISFPTPKYTAITPDGTASYSQQVLNLQTNGKYGLSGYSGTQLNSTTSADVEIAQDGKVMYQDDTGLTVKYVNASATRNKEIQSSLENIIIQAAKNTGLSVEIFSGGMTQQRRTGSDRHLNGYAADVWLYTSEGKRLNVQSQELRDWCQQAKNAGATAIGAGVGYMGAVGVHLDISAGNTVPADSAKYWGAGGRSANAPQWLINIMTS